MDEGIATNHTNRTNFYIENPDTSSKLP
jgi:hypothetical protein